MVGIGGQSNIFFLMLDIQGQTTTTHGNLYREVH